MGLFSPLIIKCTAVVTVMLDIVSADSGITQLTSTLKQTSLCPGDGGVTFTCTATGTDLTWLVGGRMMSYNANARVGSIRSNAESDEVAILVRVDTIGGRGIAERMSVLYIKPRPLATEPLRVQCHNGTVQYAREVTFWRKVADAPNMPHLLFNSTENDHVNIDWEVPVDETVQKIAHFIVQVDSHPPILVKNSTATLIVQQPTPNTTLRLRAVDECGQKGEELLVNLDVPSSRSISRSGFVSSAEAVTPPETLASPVNLEIQVALPANAAKQMFRQGYRKLMYYSMAFLIISVELVAFPRGI